VPGLIDMHTHFRDPGLTHKEDIQTGLTAAARGGFTSVVTMGNTSPVCDNEQIIKHQINRAKEVKLGKLYPVSTVTMGMLGKEATNIHDNIIAGAIAFSEDGKSVEDPAVFKQFLHQAAQFQVPVLDHCDDVRGEAYYAERDIELAGSVGSRLHIQHVSLADTVNVIADGKKKYGKLITAEAAPHHFALTRQDYLDWGVDAKMAPPLATESDRQAIIRGLADGTIDAIATDHAPHTAEEKKSDNPPNGIIGLETALPLALTHLYYAGEVDRMQLIRLMSTNPANILGIKGGTLAPGSPADITIIDPNIGHVVDKYSFASKSKNQPYHGRFLRGEVTKTICDGRTIFEK